MSAPSQETPPGPDADALARSAADLETFALLYRSRATRPLTTGDLSAILNTARERNGALRVTGLLLYAVGATPEAPHGAFVQWLEGPEGVLRGLYAAIVRDDRHDRVETLAEGPSRALAGLDARLFPRWAMALERADELPSSLNGFLSYYDLSVARGRSWR